MQGTPRRGAEPPRPGDVRPVTTGEQAVGATHHDPLVGGEPLGLGRAARRARRVRLPGAHPRREQRVDEHPGHREARRAAGHRGLLHGAGVTGAESEGHHAPIVTARRPPGATTGLVGWSVAPPPRRRECAGPTTLRGRPGSAHPARWSSGRPRPRARPGSSRACTPTRSSSSRRRPTGSRSTSPRSPVHRVPGPWDQTSDGLALVLGWATIARPRPRRRVLPVRHRAGLAGRPRGAHADAADDAVDLDLEALAAGRVRRRLADAWTPCRPAPPRRASSPRGPTSRPPCTRPAWPCRPSRTSTEVSLDVLRRFSVDQATLQHPGRPLPRGPLVAAPAHRGRPRAGPPRPTARSTPPCGPGCRRAAGGRVADPPRPGPAPAAPRRCRRRRPRARRHRPRPGRPARRGDGGRAHRLRARRPAPDGPRRHRLGLAARPGRRGAPEPGIANLRRLLAPDRR